MIRRLAGLGALAALVAALLPAPAARAGAGQESTFQDDNHLVYASPAELRRTMNRLQGLGVDRVRVTVLWKIVAPSPGSRNRPPAFDATDPAAYPPHAWGRYDAIVAEAAARGMGVNFNVTAPAPLWATRPAPRQDIAETFEPDPSEFAAFVVALGRRYSGTYPAPGGGTLPRVSYWSIWNEPNHSGWLTPTWSADSSKAYERSAVVYRSLLDGAWAALDLTGHRGDTILIGETAPQGDRSRGIKRYMQPLTFVRALYCVNRKLRPLGGSRGARLQCGDSPSRFRAAHPALFRSTGYAHHPYQLLLPPSFRPLRADDVTIGGLGRITRLLDRIHRRYGSHRRMPLYLTEYGYQTKPPDPYGVSFARQAAYLNQSEYITWRNSRVRTLSQFLLYDDREPISLTFQSGLLTSGGKAKPSLRAYRIPIWLPRSSVRRGRSVRVWGLLRPAANGAPATAAIEYRPRRSRTWRRLRTVTTRSTRNYLQARVRVRRSGHLRISWTKPGGRTYRSRAALLRVR